VTYSDAGGSTLEVTALDATYTMNLEEKVTAWPNLPDSAIAAAIFGQHTIVPRVDPTAPDAFVLNETYVIHYVIPFVDAH